MDKLHEALKESTVITMNGESYRVNVYDSDDKELHFEHEYSGEGHMMLLEELNEESTLQIYTLTEVNFR